MRSGDRRRADAYADRLGNFRAVPPGEFGDSEAERQRLQHWRAATVHQWLLAGKLLARRRAEGYQVDLAWLQEVAESHNLRSEELLRSIPEPPLIADVWRIAGDGIPIVAVRVGEHGPDNLTLPGVRWYPEFRTVSLRCDEGHLVVLGPGAANAVRAGQGVGCAMQHRLRPRKRRAPRRCRAERTGSGHGNAVAEDGEAGARRTGSGRGTACALHRPAVRSGRGDGDAVRPAVVKGGDDENRTALLSGAGHGHAYGTDPAENGNTRRSGRGQGTGKPWPQSPHRSWSNVLDAAEQSAWGEDTPAPRNRDPHEAGQPTPPVHRVRVLRTGHSRRAGGLILREAVDREPEPENLASFVRQCFAPFVGVELALPPREPMREPPKFD